MAAASRQEAARSTPSSLAIRLFGQVEVRVDDVPFRLATPRKSLQILSYVLLHRRQPVARDFLAYTLWPDDEEEQALAKFRASLADLQRVLPRGGPWLLAAEGSVRWNENAPLWLDVEAFEDTSKVAAQYAEAVALYRGDLLVALYDDWIVAPRERFCTAYLTCLEELLGDARRRRSFTEALEFARRILGVDAWREDIVRRIIATRNDAGDRAGALAEYRRFCERLRSEMGIEPMPETVALADRIARGDAAGDNDDTPLDVAIAERPIHVTPFVGREFESQRLLERWMRAERSLGGVTFVAGEAGIGKSRQALELSAVAEARGARVLIGATDAPESAPYQCIVDAFRSALPLLRAVNLPPLCKQVLSGLIPELAGPVELAPALPPVDQERARLFDAIARALAALARARPVLLVLEDLHWASEATLDAVAFIARQAASRRLMILVTLRDDEVSRGHPLRQLMRRLNDAHLSEHVALSGLDRDAVFALVAASEPIADADEVSVRLHARSNGNPLFLMHLLDAAREGNRGDLSESVAQVVNGRLSRLSNDARDAAGVAALVGLRFSSEVVREVLGWEARAVRDAIDELVDRRIARPAPGRLADDFAFVHQVVLETVASGTQGDRSAERHRRIARVLEELYPERATEQSAELARHYDLGEDRERAVKRYRASIRRALSLGALDEAETHIERALQLTADTKERIDLLLARETLHNRRGQTVLQSQDLDQLWGLAETFGDEELTLLVLLRRVRHAQKRDDDTGVSTLLDVYRGRLSGSEPSVRQARVDMIQAELLDHTGTAEEVDRYTSRALATFTAIGDVAGEARCLGLLAVLESRRNQHSLAVEHVERMRRIADRVGDYDLRRRTAECAFLINTDALVPARQAAEQWLQLAVEAGDRYAEAYARDQLATTYVYAIDGASVDAGRRLFSEALAIHTEFNIGSGIAGVGLNSSYLTLKVGRVHEAVAAIARAVHAFEEAQNLRGVLVSKALFAEALAFAGHSERGERSGLEAVQIAQTSGYTFYESSALGHLAIAQFRLGHINDAIAATKRALALREATGKATAIARNLTLLALLHLTKGEARESLEYVDRLPPEEDRLIDGCLWPQWCLWTAARAYRMAGDATKAMLFRDRAYELMMRTASGLEAEDRRYFLALAWHRELRRAAERAAWPSPA